MEIECPRCNACNELDNDDLPERACDDKEYQCANDECGHSFRVGWYATAEIR